MQALRFAATKIQPPRQRVARIERPELDAALLRAIRSHRVVLVQAPAGFGKTSLLASLLAHGAAAPLASAALADALALAWVSLDEDDDAERLLACLVAALEPHDLPWRAAPEALVELAGSDAAGLRKAATGLVNALAGAEVGHGVLVLDDLHRVEAPSAFALLDAVVQRLPPHWTLLLSTRSVPAGANAALARLRAGGELAEITQDALRFSRAETESLLRSEAGGATTGSQAQAQALYERTAGWPAGLRLALAALKTRGGAAGAVGEAAGRHLVDRHLFDYLAAEVLDGMPAPLHDFLLRVAVLPELTASRAAAVSGDPRAAEWLDHIERQGLFVTPLDANDRTLVLHDLFRDALLQRQAERLPGERPELLRRAAAGETDTLRRVGYLLKAGDWAAAEAALAGDAAELFLHGGAGEVLRLAEQFPPDRRSARLAMLGGSASALRWAWPEMVQWLEQAVAAARRDGDTGALHLAQARLAYALYPVDRNAEAEALIADLHGRPLEPVARACLLMADCMQHFRRNPHERLPVLFGELLQILESGQPLFLWWEMAPPFSWATIAGMAPLMQRYIDGATPRLADRPLPMRAELRLLQAVLWIWAGRIDDAEGQLDAADDDIAWLAVSGETQVGVRIVRAVITAMRGDGEGVREQLESLLLLEDDAPAERRELWRHQMAVYGVRLADAVGDAEALRHWCGLLRENPLVSDTAQNSRAIAARARHAAATGRWADAVAQFEKIREALPGMDVMGQRTDLTLRWAHALVKLDRLDDAARLLSPLLDRLQRDGARGQPLLAGPVLLGTLAEARWGPLLDAGQRAELTAAARFAAAVRAGAADDAGDDTAAETRSAATAAGRAGDDGLSQREREVLERIAAGDSNKVIARDLDISPHTVKRHVANILDKLALSSRGQAAAWLRDHG
jgi:LuxR family maltose regulon positive regulatory protein